MNIYIYIWGKSILVTNIKVQTFVGQSTEGARKRVSFRWGDVEGCIEFVCLFAIPKNLLGRRLRTESEGFGFVLH